jgi:hypothetical protein
MLYTESIMDQRTGISSLTRRKLASTIAGGAAAAMAFGAVPEPPSAEIENGVVKAKIHLPDSEKGYYRGTRFDWSGVIASLEHKGHSYFGVWFDKYDPKIHDAITGPVDEFLSGDGGTSTLGYDEAAVGGTFMRVGVGLLKKPAEARFQRFNTTSLTTGAGAPYLAWIP